MKTTVAFLLCVSLFYCSGIAQQKLVLKTNPLYLLEIDKYAMPVGLEYTFGNFGVQLEQMILLSKRTNDGFIEHQQFRKTNVQFRYYFDGLFLKDMKLFVGLHGTRRIHDYWESSGGYVSAGGLDIRHRGSIVEARDFGAYYILGTHVAFNSRLGMEVVGGFGFRELSIRHNPASFSFVDDLYPSFAFEESRREGTRTLPALLAQLRFNYKIF